MSGFVGRLLVLRSRYCPRRVPVELLQRVIVLVVKLPQLIFVGRQRVGRGRLDAGTRCHGRSAVSVGVSKLSIRRSAA